MIGGRTRLPSERKVDLVGGGDQISGFPLGAFGEYAAVYHLAEFHDLPAFKIGKTLYARKPKLLEWIEVMERERPFRSSETVQTDGNA
ncbi:hypothetical protein V1282_003509 [Nitrobacteraceae bacterium AZCC 2146]